MKNKSENGNSMNFSQLKEECVKSLCIGYRSAPISGTKITVMSPAAISPFRRLKDCKVKIPSNAFEVTLKNKNNNDSKQLIIFQQLNEKLFAYGNFLFHTAYPFMDYIENEAKFFSSFKKNGNMVFAIEKSADGKYNFAGMLTYKQADKNGDAKEHPISFSEDEKTGYISDCIVREDLRGYGIMTLLMNIHILQLEKNDYSKVYLRTLQESNMAKLAPKCGLKLVKNEVNKEPITQEVLSLTLSPKVPGKHVETVHKKNLTLYKMRQERIFLLRNLKENNNNTNLGM